MTTKSRNLCWMSPIMLLLLLLCTAAMADTLTITSITGPEMPLGYGWVQTWPGGFLDIHCLVAPTSATISFTFSDGTAESFAPQSDPQCQPGPIYSGTLSFISTGSDYASLISSDASSFFVSGSAGPVDLFTGFLPSGLDYYDAHAFTLTTSSGVEFDIPNWRTFGEPAPVPEPSSVLLLVSGCRGLAGVIRRKLKR